MQFKKILALTACAFGMSALQANVVTMVSQGSFEAAVLGNKVWVDNLVMEGEELDPRAGVVSFGLTFTRAGDPSRGGSLAGTTGLGQWVNKLQGGFDRATTFFGRVSHDQRQDNFEGFYEGGNGFTITFAQATTAFGFWASDIGDFTADCEGLDPRPAVCDSTDPVLHVVLTLDEGGGSTSTHSIDIAPGGTNAQELFRGFVSDRPILSVAFTNNTLGFDGQGFDSFMVADAGRITEVPTPGGVALAGLGLLALAGASTRRRR